MTEQGRSWTPITIAAAVVLSATIAVSGFSISYTATYTYTPMP